MGLASIRSTVMNAVNVANKRSEEAKNKGVNMMKVVGIRVMGFNKERTSMKCSTWGRLGHKAANCYTSRPYPKCGRN